MNDKLITGNIFFPKPICRNLSNGLEVISVKDIFPSSSLPPALYKNWFHIRK
jgi:hypothetical protein